MLSRFLHGKRGIIMATKKAPTAAQKQKVMIAAIPVRKLAVRAAGKHACGCFLH